MAYNNLMLSAKMYSLNLFLYLPSPGWCCPVLVSPSKAKLEFEKSVMTLIEVSKTEADQ